MKKFIINTIAVASLLIIVMATSCSVQRHAKRVHNYSTDAYDHRDYDRDREHRYAPPRQY